MERRITEEQITKAILTWLEVNDWRVICFDFPQSGTGVLLHPNDEIRTTKNKGAIIPDIVAVKEATALFFENKDRFVLKDFIKVFDLKIGVDYSASLNRLLENHQVVHRFFGVGLPYQDNIINQIAKHQDKIDFAVCVNTDFSVAVQYQNSSIFV